MHLLKHHTGDKYKGTPNLSFATHGKIQYSIKQTPMCIQPLTFTL